MAFNPESPKTDDFEFNEEEYMPVTEEHRELLRNLEAELKRLATQIQKERDEGKSPAKIADKYGNRAAIVQEMIDKLRAGINSGHFKKAA